MYMKNEGNEKSANQNSIVFLIPKTKNHPVGWLFILAGVEGLEPSQTVLETGVLPLTPYPYLKQYVIDYFLLPYKHNDKIR